jgi:hypothetical protein
VTFFDSFSFSDENISVVPSIFTWFTSRRLLQQLVYPWIEADIAIAKITDNIKAIGTAWFSMETDRLTG